MSDFHNRSKPSARRGDYVWQYEYYDDEEPVSFEGLRAHRYSIVIGFWVGLAVFVIFMFFVLTLLTKTGPPHPENPDSAEKRHRPGSCQVDVDPPQEENDHAFSRPLMAESRSYFHCYIGKEIRQKLDDQTRGGKPIRRGSCPRGRGLDEMEEEEEEEEEPLKADESVRDRSYFSHFNIPNFVNLEHSSALGEDDLLYEPSVMTESRLRDVC
ncbi:melanocortin-2 receptor accessory protein 2A-like [Antennarius striatus]|uniref:melanocortin-2 receptor accessory protein 2A-like n=1 Tax=Antennarius striatus TaxID=241820 RepID=UPI0035ADB968